MHYADLDNGLGALGDKDDNYGWGKVKPIAVLAQHNDEIKILKNRLGSLKSALEALSLRVGSLEGGTRKITADMASSFSDVNSSIDTLKSQIAEMERFNKNEFIKNKGLIEDLKEKSLTRMDELERALKSGDERLDAKINSETLSIREKLEIAEQNIEINKSSYDRLDRDLILISSRVTETEKDIGKLQKFVKEHEKTHIAIEAKFKEQGDKLQSVYDEHADFQNTISEHDQRIETNLNKMNQFSADFSNHVEDFRSHVNSVKTHVADFKDTKQSLKATQADFKNHMATYSKDQADFREHIQNQRLHKKIWKAPKALHEIVGVSNPRINQAVEDRKGKKQALNLIQRLFRRA